MPPSPRQLGWLPTLELVDGRQVVDLDDLAGTIYGRLAWPVVELAGGRLAVLVDDLIAGGVVLLRPNDYGPETVARA